MTRHTDDTTDESTRRTMQDVSHTNPYTGESTGQLFRRGPVVVADGGRREAVEPGTEADADDATTDGGRPEAEREARSDGADGRRMRDVSHTPPHDADDANRVFERGRETAESEE